MMRGWSCMLIAVTACKSEGGGEATSKGNDDEAAKAAAAPVYQLMETIQERFPAVGETKPCTGVTVGDSLESFANVERLAPSPKAVKWPLDVPQSTFTLTQQIAFANLAPKADPAGGDTRHSAHIYQAAVRRFSALKTLAVARVSTYDAPTLMGGNQFEPGSASGTVAVFSVPDGALLCAVPFSASNSDNVSNTGTDEQRLVTDLSYQLQAAISAALK